jgi:hypothetical protein
MTVFPGITALEKHGNNHVPGVSRMNSLRAILLEEPPGMPETVLAIAKRGHQSKG